MITHAVTRQGTTVAAVRAAHRPAWAIVTLIVGVLAALAIASTLAVLLAIGVAACHAALQTPAARRVHAERAARARRRTRHAQRERRIEAAGADTDELRQLAVAPDPWHWPCSKPMASNPAAQPHWWIWTQMTRQKPWSKVRLMPHS